MTKMAKKPKNDPLKGPKNDPNWSKVGQRVPKKVRTAPEGSNKMTFHGPKPQNRSK